MQYYHATKIIPAHFGSSTVSVTILCATRELAHEAITDGLTGSQYEERHTPGFLGISPCDPYVSHKGFSVLGDLKDSRGCHQGVALAIPGDSEASEAFKAHQKKMEDLQDAYYERPWV